MSASSAMGGAHDGVLIVVIDARDPGLTQTQWSSETARRMSQRRPPTRVSRTSAVSSRQS